MPSAENTHHIILPKLSDLSELPRATIYPINELHDERTQTLKRLLEEGHKSTAPLRNPNLKFHTHLPHHLGSAYRLGASSKQLQDAFDAEVAELLPVDDSFYRGDKICTENWTKFLNQKPYTVAYVEFFDNEVRQSGRREVLERYLYDAGTPLVNGLSGGLGHPFIHLAYAYEFQSAEVATEALSLACTELDSFHKDLAHPPLDNSTYKTSSLAEVVSGVQSDSRLDKLFHQPGFDNTFVLMQQHRDMMLEHWNAWDVANPLQQLEHICDLSVLLAIGTGNGNTQYDFFLVHVMTVAHALRVLWHDFPSERRTTILKEYGMFVLYIYIAQLRRPVDSGSIVKVDLEGRGWKWVAANSLIHDATLDSHFMKVVCAPQAFAEAFGDKDDFYLKAAVKFIEEFNGWTGFGAGTDGFDPSDV